MNMDILQKVREIFKRQRTQQVANNCYTINLIPLEFPDDKSKWITMPMITQKTKAEIMELVWRDAIEQGIVTLETKDQWQIEIEDGICMQWAD